MNELRRIDLKIWKQKACRFVLEPNYTKMGDATACVMIPNCYGGFLYFHNFD